MKGNEKDDLTRNTYSLRRYRHVKVNKDANTIEVFTGRRNQGLPYRVDLDGCDTAEACLSCIYQLHEMPWYTADKEREFIDLLIRLTHHK